MNEIYKYLSYTSELLFDIRARGRALIEFICEYENKNDSFLKESLKEYPHLKTLKMRDNKITSFGLNSLTSVPSLEDISLSVNVIGPEIDDFCQALSNNKLLALKKLDLSLNGRLGDVGAIKLFNCLLKNRTLISLDLSQTNLTEASAKAIARLIIENKYLKELNLSRNPRLTTENSLIYIYNALAYNVTLTKLNLYSGARPHKNGECEKLLKNIEFRLKSKASVLPLQSSCLLLFKNEATEVRTALPLTLWDELQNLNEIYDSTPYGLKLQPVFSISPSEDNTSGLSSELSLSLT